MCQLLCASAVLHDMHWRRDRSTICICTHTTCVTQAVAPALHEFTWDTPQTPLHTNTTRTQYTCTSAPPGHRRAQQNIGNPHQPWRRAPHACVQAGDCTLRTDITRDAPTFAAAAMRPCDVYKRLNGTAMRPCDSCMINAIRCVYLYHHMIGHMHSYNELWP